MNGDSCFGASFSRKRLYFFTCRVEYPRGEEAVAMIDYTGIECPICKQEFSKSDDIVVCPQCGAPYHRECYLKEGHCIFTGKHEAGENWTPPKRQAPPPTEKREPVGQREKACPRCGNKNYKDALFCDRCGLPFSGAQTPPPYGSPFPGGGPAGPGMPTPMGMPFMLDPMAGVDPKEEFAEGVTAGEVAKYVKSSTPYYMTTFKRMKDTGAGKFNFCAFLFTGGWMLYRKQYKKGILITAIVALLLIGSVCCNLLFTMPILNNLAALAKLDPNSTAILTMTDYMKMFEQLGGISAGDQFLLFLPSILRLLNWVVMFIVGFNGNRMYMKHCIEKVRELKAQNPTEAAFNEAVQTQGGVNTALALCLFLCYMIINSLPYFLIS